MRTLLVPVTFSLLLAVTSVADAKHSKRHRQPAKPAQAVDLWRAPGAGFQQQPARMIEVRPGRYVSSYGCVQDEGYGRYSPCDLSDGNR